MTNSLTKTRTTTKSYEGEEIIWDGQEEREERKDDKQRDRRLFPIREKISREQLIKSDDKRSSIELTVSA